MKREIERKFLVNESAMHCDTSKTYLGTYKVSQAYIVDWRNYVLRARVLGDSAYLTFKTPNKGISRGELEVRVPKFIAKAFMLFSRKVLHKSRTYLKIDGLTWEVDKFHNLKHPLIVAEVELDNESQQLTIPDWAVVEVSHDPKYYNSNLVKEAV